MLASTGTVLILFKMDSSKQKRQFALVSQSVLPPQALCFHFDFRSYVKGRHFMGLLLSLMLEHNAKVTLVNHFGLVKRLTCNREVAHDYSCFLEQF